MAFVLVFAKVIIMKIKNYLFIVWALAALNVQADTLQLDLCLLYTSDAADE